MSNQTTTATEIIAPPAPRTARRGWAHRLTSHLGAYGITAAIGAGTLAAFLPMCAPAPAPTTQQQVVDQTNARRADNGLAPLTMNSTLTAVAQAHAADQASVDTMSHTGTDGSDAGTRIVNSGYPTYAWGENVAGGYTTPDAVMAAWMNSPGHRANILNGTFTQIGIGLAYAADGTPYWSMELAAPADPDQVTHAGVLITGTSTAPTAPEPPGRLRVQGHDAPLRSHHREPRKTGLLPSHG